MTERIEDVVKKAKPAEEILALRNEIADLKRRIATYKPTHGRVEQVVHEVVDVVPPLAPVPVLYRPPRKTAADRSEVVMVPHATDWHIGATTIPEYIEEFGAFNWDLAKSRVREWLAKLVQKAEVVRRGYTCRRCVILGTADWVSGDIHEELVRTNEFPCPVQAVNAGFLLAEFGMALSQHFEHVEMHILPAGNHDRVTKKPQSEQGTLNSWGYITLKIAEQAVSKQPNISFHPILGAKGVVEVGGMKYLLMHGDGIPAHMGVPHFGMDRLVMREFLARAKMLPEKQFDAVACGHWHVANNLMYARYGGSLSGTTAHDHKFGRHSLPHQTSWLVHHKHGEFDWTRWWL